MRRRHGFSPLFHVAAIEQPWCHQLMSVYREIISYRLRSCEFCVKGRCDNEWNTTAKLRGEDICEGVRKSYKFEARFNFVSCRSALLGFLRFSESQGPSSHQSFDRMSSISYLVDSHPSSPGIWYSGSPRRLAKARSYFIKSV